MGHAAKILADSISPDGVRLTTFEVTFPRIVLAEWNTHRMFSRNSASSRAIPVEKMIKRVMEDPYVPSSWGKNQKGMQADVEVSAGDAAFARVEWLLARDMAVQQASSMVKIGIHKQLTNRLLEPFMWHTVICTSTEYANFFHLRDNAAAHPDIQTPARMMRELYEKHEPVAVGYNQWHMPLVPDAAAIAMAKPQGTSDMVDALCKISVARCARVSYLTHDGQRDLQADIDLYDRLLESGHLSPFEHVARPMTHDDFNDSQRGVLYNEEIGLRPNDAFCGNLRGWVSCRKLIPHEADILGARP